MQMTPKNNINVWCNNQTNSLLAEWSQVFYSNLTKFIPPSRHGTFQGSFLNEFYHIKYQDSEAATYKYS